MRAEVVTARCATSGRLHGMRMQEAESGTWLYTWAFPLAEKAAEREGYGSSAGIHGKLQMGDGWPGCPSCGNASFVLCNSCQRVTCHPDYKGWFKCRWCPSQGEVGGHIDHLQARGDG